MTVKHQQLTSGFKVGGGGAGGGLRARRTHPIEHASLVSASAGSLSAQP